MWDSNTGFLDSFKSWLTKPKAVTQSPRTYTKSYFPPPTILPKPIPIVVEKTQQVVSENSKTDQKRLRRRSDPVQKSLKNGVIPSRTSKRVSDLLAKKTSPQNGDSDSIAKPSLSFSSDYQSDRLANGDGDSSSNHSKITVNHNNNEIKTDVICSDTITSRRETRLRSRSAPRLRLTEPVVRDKPNCRSNTPRKNANCSPRNPLDSPSKHTADDLLRSWDLETSDKNETESVTSSERRLTRNRKSGPLFPDISSEFIIENASKKDPNLNTLESVNGESCEDEEYGDSRTRRRSLRSRSVSSARPTDRSSSDHSERNLRKRSVSSGISSDSSGRSSRSVQPVLPSASASSDESICSGVVKVDRKRRATSNETQPTKRIRVGSPKSKPSLGQFRPQKSSVNDVYDFKDDDPWDENTSPLKRRMLSLDFLKASKFVQTYRYANEPPRLSPQLSPPLLDPVSAFKADDICSIIVTTPKTTPLSRSITKHRRSKASSFEEEIPIKQKAHHKSDSVRSHKTRDQSSMGNNDSCVEYDSDSKVVSAKSTGSCSDIDLDSVREQSIDNDHASKTRGKVLDTSQRRLPRRQSKRLQLAEKSDQGSQCLPDVTNDQATPDPTENIEDEINERTASCTVESIASESVKNEILDSPKRQLRSRTKLCQSVEKPDVLNSDSCSSTVDEKVVASSKSEPVLEENLEISIEKASVVEQEIQTSKIERFEIPQEKNFRRRSKRLLQEEEPEPILESTTEVSDSNSGIDMMENSSVESSDTFINEERPIENDVIHESEEVVEQEIVVKRKLRDRSKPSRTSLPLEDKPLEHSICDPCVVSIETRVDYVCRENGVHTDADNSEKAQKVEDTTAKEEITEKKVRRRSQRLQQEVKSPESSCDPTTDIIDSSADVPFQEAGTVEDRNVPAEEEKSNEVVIQDHEVEELPVTRTRRFSKRLQAEKSLGIESVPMARTNPSDVPKEHNISADDQGTTVSDEQPSIQNSLECGKGNSKQTSTNSQLRDNLNVVLKKCEIKVFALDKDVAASIGSEADSNDVSISAEESQDDVVSEDSSEAKTAQIPPKRQLRSTSALLQSTDEPGDLVADASCVELDLSSAVCTDSDNHSSVESNVIADVCKSPMAQEQVTDGDDDDDDNVPLSVMIQGLRERSEMGKTEQVSSVALSGSESECTESADSNNGRTSMQNGHESKVGEEIVPVDDHSRPDLESEQSPEIVEASSSTRANCDSSSGSLSYVDDVQSRKVVTLHNVADDSADTESSQGRATRQSKISELAVKRRLRSSIQALSVEKSYEIMDSSSKVEKSIENLDEVVPDSSVERGATSPVCTESDNCLVGEDNITGVVSNSPMSKEQILDDDCDDLPLSEMIQRIRERSKSRQINELSSVNFTDSCESSRTSREEPVISSFKMSQEGNIPLDNKCISDKSKTLRSQNSDESKLAPLGDEYFEEKHSLEDSNIDTNVVPENSDSVSSSGTERDISIKSTNKAVDAVSNKQDETRIQSKESPALRKLLGNGKRNSPVLRSLLVKKPPSPTKTRTRTPSKSRQHLQNLQLKNKTKSPPEIPARTSVGSENSDPMVGTRTRPQRVKSSSPKSQMYREKRKRLLRAARLNNRSVPRNTTVQNDVQVKSEKTVDVGRDSPARKRRRLDLEGNRVDTVSEDILSENVHDSPNKMDASGIDSMCDGGDSVDGEVAISSRNSEILSIQPSPEEKDGKVTTSGEVSPSCRRRSSPPKKLSDYVTSARRVPSPTLDVKQHVGRKRKRKRTGRKEISNSSDFEPYHIMFRYLTQKKELLNQQAQEEQTTGSAIVTS